MAADARGRLITSAIALIRRRGVAGTAVSDLLEHSGTARQSIYKHFPDGKSELIEESVRVAGTMIEQMIEQMTETLAPTEMLRALVDYWKWVLTDSDFQAGCPIAAAAYAGTDAPGARDVASRTFHRWEDRLAENAIAQGIAADRAHTLATTVIASIEGAIMMSVADRSCVPLDRTHDQLHDLLDMYLGAGSTPAQPALRRMAMGSGDLSGGAPSVHPTPSPSPAPGRKQS
ncbi:TetR/AcrR family transcriptional regulator [Nocardia halotolerans]|uniref:TetR/AcrR family transcriptional regulator n=1 Tax=Nocardia halotolerans TaxID=1755878 RepID=A0ABV8VR84_9NOCA